MWMLAVIIFYKQAEICITQRLGPEQGTWEWMDFPRKVKYNKWKWMEWGVETGIGEDQGPS